MDRELIVLKEGYTLGEVVYKYETQTSGLAYIQLNKIVEIEHGMKAMYPLYQCEVEFSHEEFDSIEAAIAFDKLFFKKQPEMEPQLEGDIAFTYPAVRYRYVISPGGVLGIVNIDADFLANKKDLQLISALRIKNDRILPSDSLECNITLLKRLCTVEGIGGPAVKFAEVNRK
jgi:hypothetical protein